MAWLYFHVIRYRPESIIRTTSVAVTGWLNQQIHAMRGWVSRQKQPRMAWLYFHVIRYRPESIIRTTSVAVTGWLSQ